MNRKLNWANSILLVLGVGHLALTIVLDRARVANWLGDGLWATVPLLPERSVDELQKTTSLLGRVGKLLCACASPLTEQAR